MSVTTMDGTELYAETDNIMQGKTTEKKRVKFQPAVVQEVSIVSKVQFRKINIHHSRDASAETVSLRDNLRKMLEGECYLIVSDTRKEAIEGVHIEDLKNCTTLHVSDSYGAPGYNGFTTSNHFGLVLPGARTAVVQRVAVWLCVGYAPNTKILLVQSGTNDFLQTHATLVKARISEQHFLPKDQVRAKADQFAMTLSSWNLKALENARPEVTAVVVAPLHVHMPSHTRSKDEKARLLELFNDTCLDCIEKRLSNARNLNTCTIIILKGLWLLSPDEVHLKAFQTPLMYYEIERELKKLFPNMDPIIDEPRAVSTFYIQGYRRYVRDSEIKDNSKRAEEVWKTHKEEVIKIKRSMMPQSTPALDSSQTPFLCQRLTTASQGAKREMEEFDKIPMDQAKKAKRPAMKIPEHCPKNSGPMSTAIYDATMDLEMRTSEVDFRKRAVLPIREITRNERYTTDKISQLETVFRKNKKWTDHEADYARRGEESETMRGPHAQKYSRNARKAKVDQMTLTDVSLKDWGLLPALFPDLEQGPQTFWREGDQINEERWNTMCALLDAKTIKFIAPSTYTLKAIQAKKRQLKTQMVMWIKGLITGAEGGMCQAELEVITGFHFLHLQAIIGNGVITMLTGLKCQEPIAAPKQWRRGDECIFYLPRYLQGTRYKPDSKVKRPIDHKKIDWTNGGIPDNCNVLTESKKAIVLMSSFYGSRQAVMKKIKVTMEAHRKGAKMIEPSSQDTEDSISTELADRVILTRSPRTGHEIANTTLATMATPNQVQLPEPLPKTKRMKVRKRFESPRRDDTDDEACQVQKKRHTKHKPIVFR